MNLAGCRMVPFVQKHFVWEDTEHYVCIADFVMSCSDFLYCPLVLWSLLVLLAIHVSHLFGTASFGCTAAL